MGFTSDDIYVGVALDRDTLQQSLAAFLRTQGKQFVWTIAPLHSRELTDRGLDSREAIHEAWGAVVEAWNGLPSDSALWGFEGSMIRAMGPTALLAIINKGIHVPCTDPDFRRAAKARTAAPQQHD